MLPKNRAGGKAAAAECADVADDEYLDGKIANAAIRKLREVKNSGKPFFLAVGFKKPHMPFAAPKKYWDMYKREDLAAPACPDFPAGAPPIADHDWPEARGYTDIPDKGPVPPAKAAELRHGYYAATSYMDAQLGRVMDELNRLGLDKNTVISLYGDHGFHVGEQDMWGKLTNYDTGTRAPMFIAHPQQHDKGAAVDRAVEFLDLYPTLAEICGLQPPEHLEGESVADVLNDRNAKVKDFAISQFARPVSYNFTQRNPKNMGYTIRTEHYRYTRWIEFETGKLRAEEFYDLKDGRLERKNEIDNPAYARVVEKLKHRLNRIPGATP